MSQILWRDSTTDLPPITTSMTMVGGLSHNQPIHRFSNEVIFELSNGDRFVGRFWQLFDEKGVYCYRWKTNIKDDTGTLRAVFTTDQVRRWCDCIPGDDEE